MDILTFFADFGVFGVDETFSQHRMGDINHASIKLICTHNGLDVGEDGKTHQCVDYIGNMLNLFGFKILVPADANQADRITRYVATNHGNMVINMGRSKLPVITDESGKPFFGEDYTYEYGKADWLRKGSDATIITCGTMVGRAISAADRLKTEGISVGVLNISSPNAIDIEALAQAAATGFIVTYEDHSVYTGLGSVICSNMAENGLWARVKKLGITQYGGSAAPDIQFAKQGLDVDSLIKAIKDGIILK
jgi:transketolase